MELETDLDAGDPEVEEPGREHERRVADQLLRGGRGQLERHGDREELQQPGAQVATGLLAHQPGDREVGEEGERGERALEPRQRDAGAHRDLDLFRAAQDAVDDRLGAGEARRHRVVVEQFPHLVAVDREHPVADGEPVPFGGLAGLEAHDR